MIRKALVGFALVLLLLIAGMDGVVAQDDIPAQCRTIIGCADAGPKPENPGDRGGYAQLLTLVVLIGGVGFVMTKVFSAARAAQPPPDPKH